MMKIHIVTGEKRDFFFNPETKKKNSLSLSLPFFPPKQDIDMKITPDLTTLDVLPQDP